jgi:hypothetical protein
MAEHESAHSPEHCNHLTRRAALKRTAIVGTVALPAGGAMALALPNDAAAAELPGDVDPGLAAIEAGYREWQELLASADALGEQEDEARGRAGDRVPEADDPEPVPSDPDVAKLWKGPSGLIDDARDPASYVKIPQDLLDRFDAFQAEWSRWWDRKPRLDRNDPDFRNAVRLERQQKTLWREADRLRHRLLKVPTTSPRGLLIKLALATDTERFEDFDDRFRRSRYHGTFDICEDLMPPLLADLRAMTTGTA